MRLTHGHLSHEAINISLPNPVHLPLEVKGWADLVAVAVDAAQLRHCTAAQGIKAQHFARDDFFYTLSPEALLELSTTVDVTLSFKVFEPLVAHEHLSKKRRGLVYVSGGFRR